MLRMKRPRRYTRRLQARSWPSPAVNPHKRQIVRDDVFSVARFTKPVIVIVCVSDLPGVDVCPANLAMFVIPSAGNELLGHTSTRRHLRSLP